MKGKLLGIVAAVALTAPVAAHATLVTYDFTVTGNGGTFDGVSSSGYFSYDDGIVPVGGGTVASQGSFVDFAFTWAGITYTTATANTGTLIFDALGNLSQMLFGTSCGTLVCSLASNQTGWAVRNSEFFYTYAPDNGIWGGGTVALTARASVPEPATLGLLGLGLVGAAFARRRSAR